MSKAGTKGICLSIVGYLLVGEASHAGAATIAAISCSPADVQTAVDSARAGDIVSLPRCNYASWDTTVNITKGIVLEGQGVGQTVLQRARVPADYESNEMFLVANVTGFEMRDIALEGTYDTDPNVWRDMGVVLRNDVDFQIHDVAFANLAAGLQVTGDPTAMRGVIFHNTFTDIYYRDSTGSALGYGVSMVGNGTWPDLELGTAQNVFIEDNTFTRNRHCVASNNSSRYVFRYNTIFDNREDAAAIDAHGYTGIWPRGSRQYEVYNNTVKNSVPRYGGVGPRGGDGVIFNNQFSANITEEIQLLMEQECAGTYPVQDQIRELYLWNNTLIEGGDAPIFVHCPDYTQLGRDYFTTARPGYTPYTYPHPLRQGASGDTIAPAFPRKLRLV